MAGSFNHCVITADEDDVSPEDVGKFRGVGLLDHLGDAYEALEEMYGMIWWLATYLPGDSAALVEEARQKYQKGLEYSPGIKVED